MGQEGVQARLKLVMPFRVGLIPALGRCTGVARPTPSCCSNRRAVLVV